MKTRNKRHKGNRATKGLVIAVEELSWPSKEEEAKATPEKWSLEVTRRKPVTLIKMPWD